MFSAGAVRTRIAELDDAFHAVGGQEGVAEDLVRFLPDAVYSAGPLDQADDGPGEVVVDDDGAVLEVLAFAEDVGGHQHADFLFGGDPVALVVADGAEPPGECGGVGGVAGDAFERRNAARRSSPSR